MQLPFPSGMSYAFIRMDPLTMVENLGLNDPGTLAAVAEMKPQKYLIYLEYALDLPLPRSRWCRYSMSPIGSTLRAKDRKHRLLPDMVIPIFPNTQCSSEKRPPIRPNSPFPLPNCFHWIENITKIRVQRRSNGGLFDNVRSVRLNGKQHVALQRAFSDDYDRVVSSSPSDCGEDTSSSTEGYAPSRAGSHPVIPPDALQDPTVRQACSPLGPSRPLPSRESTPRSSQMTISSQSDGPSRPWAVHHLGIFSESESDSGRSSSQSELDEKRQSLVEEISELNLFGWDPDPTFPLIPLVDLWLELEEHIHEDDIPSPVDWYKEEEQIVSIILDGLTRRSRSASSIEPTMADSPGPQDGEPATSSAQSDHPPSEIPNRTLELRKWRPRALQKLGSRARWVLRRAVRALCLGRDRASTD